MPKAIFIAATGQDVGKTTTSLGVVAGLKKRYPQVGFLKPVGQVHVQVESGAMVDKDVVLFKEHFQLPYACEQMSPVLLPAGFTRHFLDGKIESGELKAKIAAAYTEISRCCDFCVIEGTGHVGVGSIVELSNADVASLLGVDVVLVASGGLGSAFDELALSYTLCRQKGINIRGVILNRVVEDKRAMILDYFPRALRRWNIPLLGCIPYLASLSSPCMADFEALFGSPLLCGEESRYRHFQHIRLVTTTVDNYMQFIMPSELIIAHVSREDIILTNVAQHLHFKQKNEGADLQGGMILTGSRPPRPGLLQQIEHAGIPVLYAPLSSYTATKKINSFTAKIRREDKGKVAKAIELVEKHVDFDALCRAS